MSGSDREGTSSTARCGPAVDAFTPRALEAVERLLRERWDPAGDLLGAAAVRGPRDPAAPRTAAALAATVCGILDAGGTRAELVEFLRGEEIALLGAARTSPRELGAIARAAWLLARGRDPEAPGGGDA